MENEVTTDPHDNKPVAPSDVKPISVSSDFILELTNDTGQTSVQTDTINKKLDCIIVDSQESTEIVIESELGYLLFHRTEHIGTKYYCIRSRTTTPTEKMIDYSDFEKFNLNEKLIVTIRGRKKEKVKLIFRFD